MNWLTIIIKLLPFIFSMMNLAEKVMSDEPKSGADKKTLVVESAKIAIAAIAGVSTGGQAETWNKIAEPISTIIDSAAGMLFPNDDLDDINI